MSSKAKTQINRRNIKLDPQAPFSHGVLVGDTLYLSGRIGLDSKTKKIPPNIEMEARNLMEDMRTVLSQADMTMSDLVYVQVFCADVSLWERFNSVYTTYFDGDLPARAFIGAGTLLFDAHFEVQGIAVRR